VVHLAHDNEENVTFDLEVDFLGDGSWQRYQVFRFRKGTGTTSFPMAIPPTGSGAGGPRL
jgi:hypothetical protein